MFSTLGVSNNHNGLALIRPESSTQMQSLPPPDLETRVCEIAAREGVHLPAKKPQTIKSVTIASCKRSSSPTPGPSPVAPLSPAPDRLPLTELSTESVRPTTVNKQLSLSLNEDDRAALVEQTTREPSVCEPSSKTQSVTSQSSPIKKRQDTLGGQREELPLFSAGLEEDMTVSLDSSQSLSQDQTSSVSDAGHRINQVTGPFAAVRPTWTGHHSPVHLSLLSRANHYTFTSAVVSTPDAAVSELRDSSSAASSPDEGVGSSSPVECYETRGPDKSGTVLFKNVALTAKSSKSASPYHRPDMSKPRTLSSAPGKLLKKRTFLNTVIKLLHNFSFCFICHRRVKHK